MLPRVWSVARDRHCICSTGGRARLLVLEWVSNHGTTESNVDLTVESTVQTDEHESVKRACEQIASVCDGALQHCDVLSDMCRMKVPFKSRFNSCGVWYIQMSEENPLECR